MTLGGLLAGGGKACRSCSFDFGLCDLPVMVAVQPGEHFCRTFRCGLRQPRLKLRLAGRELFAGDEAVVVQIEPLEHALHMGRHLGSCLVRCEKAAARMRSLRLRRRERCNLSDCGTGGAESGEDHAAACESVHSDNLQNGHYRASEW